MMVVGVVGNVKQSLVSDMPTEMYVPFRQANEVLPVRNMSFVVRTEVDPRSVIPELRETVHKINPNQPVVRIRTMEENVDQNFSQPRFRTLLLVVFAGIALLIAALGVYGVMAYATVQRSGEMAIRMALGCSIERIFMLVLTDGLRLTLIGVGIGTVLGIALGRWLKSLLFGVSAVDAVSIAARGCCRGGGGSSGIAHPRAESLPRRCHHDDARELRVPATRNRAECMSPGD